MRTRVLAEAPPYTDERLRQTALFTRPAFGRLFSSCFHATASAPRVRSRLAITLLEQGTDPSVKVGRPRWRRRVTVHVHTRE
jgi:hypothetical protein